MSAEKSPVDNSTAVERRAGPAPTLLMLMTKNQESHQQTLEKLGELSAKLVAHIDSEPASLQAAISEGVRTALADAFPNGDAVTHRKRHEAEIVAEDDRKKTVRTLIVEIAKGLATAFLVWVGITMWNAFLRGPSP